MSPPPELHMNRVPHSTFISNCVFHLNRFYVIGYFDRPTPKTIWGIFCLRQTGISYSGVDGFQENPRGDSVQSKDNMRIGKILQNIAFIRNSIHRLTQEKQHQILRDSNWASHKILVLPPLLHYVSTSEPLPIIKSIVNCSQCNGFFGTNCYLQFSFLCRFPWQLKRKICTKSALWLAVFSGQF